MRSEGAVIDIDIEYSNAKHWNALGQSVPVYTITARLLPMRYYRISYDQVLNRTHRHMHDVHGLLFLISVHGAIRVFDFVKMLTVLTTALVSVTMASTITDFIMQHLFTFSSSYTVLKYQPTHDFSELKTHVDELKKQHGRQYSPVKHKHHTLSQILNRCARDNRIPEGRELLALLLKFEQRLNRLD